MTTKTNTDTPADIQKWFSERAAGLWPAALGCLSLRRSRCIRDNCQACLSGEQHLSYVLYGRSKEGRFAIYIPEQLVPEINRALENGRALQDLLYLLYQNAKRYTKALKQETASRKKEKK
jgi:hypothetical protein